MLIDLVTWTNSELCHGKASHEQGPHVKEYEKKPPRTTTTTKRNPVLKRKSRNKKNQSNKQTKTKKTEER